MKKMIILLFFVTIHLFAQEPFWKPISNEFYGKNISKILFSSDYNFLFISIDSTLLKYSMNTNSIDTLFKRQIINSSFFYDNSKLYVENKRYELLYSVDLGKTWINTNIPDGWLYFVIKNKIFTARWIYNPGVPPSVYGIWISDGIGANLQFFSSSPFEVVTDINAYYQNRIYYHQIHPSFIPGNYSAYSGQVGTKITEISNFFVDSTNGDYYYSLNNNLYKKISNNTITYPIGNVNNMMFTADKILVVSSTGFNYKLRSSSNFIQENSGLTGIGNFITLDNEGFMYIGANNGVYKSRISINNLVSVEDEIELPQSFSLEQNYPNPFNPSTTIKFNLPEQNYVTIKVFDVLGREIKTLISEEKPAGNYEAEFNAEGLTSGVYFYRIDAGNYSSTRKMILMK